MTISCSKCGHSITSVIIDKELAWKECFDRLGKHVLRQHALVFNAVQQGIQKVMVAVAVNMMTEECATIPEEEEFVLAHLDGMQELIMMAAGFDAEASEEPEDDEEDEEEDNDSEELEVIDTSEAKKEVEEPVTIPATPISIP